MTCSRLRSFSRSSTSSSSSSSNSSSSSGSSHHHYIHPVGGHLGSQLWRTGLWGDGRRHCCMLCAATG
jgi:hypothetical protein